MIQKNSHCLDRACHHNALLCSLKQLVPRADGTSISLTPTITINTLSTHLNRSTNDIIVAEITQNTSGVHHENHVTYTKPDLLLDVVVEQNLVHPTTDKTIAIISTASLFYSRLLSTMLTSQLLITRKTLMWSEFRQRLPS